MKDQFRCLVRVARDTPALICDTVNILDRTFPPTKVQSNPGLGQPCTKHCEAVYSQNVCRLHLQALVTVGAAFTISRFLF